MNPIPPPPPGTPPGVPANVCVLIDFENLERGTLQTGYGHFDAGLVLHHLRRRGPVRIARAYADFTRYAPHARELLKDGVMTCQLSSSEAGKLKNGADIALVVDAICLALQSPWLDTFVILSGDVDFIPLLFKLKELGKTVIFCGVEEITSTLLLSSADEFLSYGTLYRAAGRRQIRHFPAEGRDPRDRDPRDLRELPEPPRAEPPRPPERPPEPARAAPVERPALPERPAAPERPAPPRDARDRPRSREDRREGREDRREDRREGRASPAGRMARESRDVRPEPRHEIRHEADHPQGDPQEDPPAPLAPDLPPEPHDGRDTRAPGSIYDAPDTRQAEAERAAADRADEHAAADRAEAERAEAERAEAERAELERAELERQERLAWEQRERELHRDDGRGRGPEDRKQDARGNADPPAGDPAGEVELSEGAGVRRVVAGLRRLQKGESPVRFHALWEELCRAEPGLEALSDGYRRFQDWAHAAVQSGYAEQLKRSRLGSGLRLAASPPPEPARAEEPARPEPPAPDQDTPAQGDGDPDARQDTHQDTHHQDTHRQDTHRQDVTGDASQDAALAQGIAWMVEELRRIADPPRWVQGSQISDALIQRGPEYDYRRWWSGSFGRLLDHLEQQGVVSVRQQGRNRPKEIRLNR